MTTHTYSPNTILSGSTPIRSFEHQGVHRSADSVPVIYLFQKIGTTTGGTEVFFDLNETVIPLSIWVLYSSGVDPNGTVTVNVRNSANTIVWSLVLNVNQNIEDNAFVYNFPLFVIEKGFTISVISSINNAGISIYAKVGYLEEVVNAR